MPACACKTGRLVHGLIAMVSEERGGKGVGDGLSYTTREVLG
jgi:hypothetical protein